MAGSKRSQRRLRDDNQGLIVALRHPLRRRILQHMSDERKASPSELSRELSEPLSSVAYHVRVLAERRALRRVSRRQVRGTTQHFYRWSVQADWVRAMLEEDGK